MYYVEAKSGPLEGSKFPIKRRLIIGRDPEADVQLISSGVSRQHAAIILDDKDEVFVMDLASKNGTFLGEVSVGREPLRVGQSFRVGDTEFLLGESRVELAEFEEPVHTLHLASGPAVTATIDGHPLTPEEADELLAKRKR